jgi:hypothetical protein
MLISVLRGAVLVALVATVGAESVGPSTDDGSPFFEGPPIFDIAVVATAAPESVVGAEVVAEDVCVRELTRDGFWVTPDQDDARAFVHPAEGPLIDVRVGESVTVRGEVRLTTTPNDPGAANQTTDGRSLSGPVPYVYAYTVRPAWPPESAARAFTRTAMCASSRQGG